MKDATEVVVVLDKSGSMHRVVDDTIGGFNQFLQDQKDAEEEKNLTLIQFNHCYDVLYEGKPIGDCEPLTRSTYSPSGTTALLDAVACGIINTGRRLEEMSEESRPDKVIFVVITDGYENASKEHTRDQVREMVKHQTEKYSWVFLYLAANVDAFSESSKLGIEASRAVQYSATGQGVVSAHAGVSRAVKQYIRTRSLADEKWKKGIE